MEVGGHGLSKLFPVGRADRGEVLPGVVQDAHVVMHGHEVNDEAEAESAEPDAEAAYGLGSLGPGLAFKGHDPGRADPGSDNGEHHAGLGRVLGGVEFGEAELHELFRIEIGEGKVAEDAFEETVDEEQHGAHGNQGEHDTLLEGMGVTDPFLLEGPEVEGVGHPDKDDEPPTAVIVAKIGSVQAHDAARVLEYPPRDGEYDQREREVHESRYGASPSFNELALFQIRKLFVRHKFLLVHSTGRRFCS